MKFLLYLALSGIHFSALASSAAVTYGLSGGRLGDNLVAYSNALWVAYKREIPLVYFPFDNCERFTLSRIHDSYWAAKDKYSKIVKFDKDEKLDMSNLKIDENTLYSIPFFPAFKREIIESDFFCAFDVDWHDEGFVAALRRGISLVDREPSLINFPEGRIPIALHIRTGEGFDPVYQLRTAYDQSSPRKFPPNSFFIEQLKHMSELLEDQPLYVHIFTDSSRPEYFAELLKKEVNKSNIIYGYRNKPGLVDDFFAMAQFKYFIRGESNFSFMASILAQYKICIVPAECVWKGRELIVTKSEVIIR